MISVLTNSVLIGIFGLDFNNCKYGDGAKIQTLSSNFNIDFVIVKIMLL
jgi:hypothetical protein